MIAEPDATCIGVAYLVSPETFAALDVREKNGYLRLATELTLDDGRHVNGLVYIATPANAAFLGAASEREIALHISRSHGPSGANRDYVLHLADALRQLGADDPHVFAIERELLRLEMCNRLQMTESECLPGRGKREVAKRAIITSDRSFPGGMFSSVICSKAGTEHEPIRRLSAAVADGQRLRVECRIRSEESTGRTVPDRRERVLRWRV